MLSAHICSINPPIDFHRNDNRYSEIDNTNGEESLQQQYNKVEGITFGANKRNLIIFAHRWYTCSVNCIGSMKKCFVTKHFLCPVTLTISLHM